MMVPPRGRLVLEPIWAALAVALLTVAAYANAAPPVLLYDDEVVIRGNPGLQLSRVPEMFGEPARAGVGGNQRLYRPLAMATLAADRALWNDDMRGFHWSSITLHVATTLALMGLLLALGAGWAGAAGAALVFGVHPVHTEAVDVAYNRSEVLAALGVVAGLWWLWHWFPRRRGLALAGASAFYFLALLSRESAVSFPVLALALLVLLPRGPRPGWRDLAGLAALALPLAAYLALRQWALGEVAGGVLRSFGEQGILGATAPRLRLALVAATLRDYWGLMAWPHPLQASYEEYTLKAAPLALLVNAVLLVLAAGVWRRLPALTAGIVFFYVALLPSTRLFADPALMAERFVYLPSLGLAIPLAFALHALERRRGAAAAVSVALAVSAVLGPLTWQRNRAWHSAEALWQAEMRASPGDWKALLNLSQVYIDRRQFEEAIALCDRGLVLSPGQAGFHTNRGVALVALQRFPEAEAAFGRAVTLSRGGVTELLHLARVLVVRGRTVQAERVYEEALAAEDDPALQHAIRGELLLRCRSDVAGAQAAWAAALTLSPNLPEAQEGLRALAPVPDAR